MYNKSNTDIDTYKFLKRILKSNRYCKLTSEDLASLSNILTLG